MGETGTSVRSRIGSWLSALPFQPRLLVILIAVAALIWIFGALAEDVMEKESHAFDIAIMQGLRHADDLSRPIGPGWLLAAFRDITALGSPTVVVIVTALAAGYLLSALRVRLAVLTVSAIALGAVVEKSLKWFFDRPRPDIVPHLVEVHTLSFPSGHAMLSAMMYLTLGALVAEAQGDWRRRSFILVASFLIVSLIGASRVYLGVHWPSDVLAGWAGGAAWALIFWYVGHRITAHAGRDPET